MIKKYAKKTCALFASSEAVKTSFYFVAIIYICYTITTGKASITVFTTIVTAYTVLSSKINALFKIDGDLTTLLHQNNRIQKFFEHNSHIENLSSQGRIPKTNTLRGLKIVFSHVYFHYPNNPDFQLRDLNFVVEPGKTLAIVGLNGAGKSTLIKLLLRFYDVDAGDIYINDVNIKDVDINCTLENGQLKFRGALAFGQEIYGNALQSRHFPGVVLCGRMYP